MNCKEGDWAFVVAPTVKKIHWKIVRCVRFLGGIDNGIAADYWKIDRKLGRNHAGVISDRLLRPIRDQPGADETLSWCDVPKEVTACDPPNPNPNRPTPTQATSAICCTVARTEHAAGHCNASQGWHSDWRRK